MWDRLVNAGVGRGIDNREGALERLPDILAMIKGLYPTPACRPAMENESMVKDESPAISAENK
jgi:hypothetical protein